MFSGCRYVDFIADPRRHWQFPNGRGLTLGVIGASGCGKTTFIKRSLKRRGLTVSESKLVEVAKMGICLGFFTVCDPLSMIMMFQRAERRTNHPFHLDQDRHAYINVVLSKETGMSQTFYNATILEMNISELINPNNEKPCENGWPTCLPRVDGVFVCYDASDRSSFANIVNILSKYLLLSWLLISCSLTKLEYTGGPNSLEDPEHGSGLKI